MGATPNIKTLLKETARCPSLEQLPTTSCLILRQLPIYKEPNLDSLKVLLRSIAHKKEEEYQFEHYGARP